ncbi:MAG TPA: TRAM domain-containing protein [Gemmatimonadales bacterium]|nr:TRAM domain-containing protein [Gemmatimonadales bacterium]
MSDNVTVTGIAAGGDGVGRLADGRAVFVPRTVPGDKVELRAVSVRRNFARGEIARVLEPGPARVGSVCPHYVQDRCAGCQLQHLAYDAQVEAKRTVVGDALRRIGKLDVPDPECVEAVDEWRYQTKISLGVSRRSAEGVTIGLHPYDQTGRVFPLVDCHITSFALMELWREVKAHVALLPVGLTRLTLRLDRDGGRHVIAESSREPWLKAEALRGALSDPGRVTCWWQPTDGAARVVAGGRTGLPATAFEQVNPDMESLVRSWGVDQLGELTGRVVWDLYGGAGDTAVLLAERGASVLSVDADELAVAWARTRNVSGARFIAGRAEDVLATLPEPAAVIVNPPRAGLHWTVTLRLQERPVPRVVYVSSDPATLARDLQRLSVNYRVAAVRAFDLFPQTAHVETVAVLVGAS